MDIPPGPIMMQTPSQMGFRMPAEWEPHAATWLTWPRPDGISFPNKYEPVPAVIVVLAFANASEKNQPFKVPFTMLKSPPAGDELTVPSPVKF